MKQYLGIDIAKHEHVLGSRYENGEQHGANVKHFFPRGDWVAD